MIGPPLSVLPVSQSRQVKVVAVTGSERLASMPEVPTLNESGIPFVASAWLGVCAGSGTPQPIIELLSTRIEEIIKSQDYRTMIEKSGSVALNSSTVKRRGAPEG